LQLILNTDILKHININASCIELLYNLPAALSINQA